MRLSTDLLEQLQEAINGTDAALTAFATVQSAKIRLAFEDEEGTVEVEIGYLPQAGQWTVSF